MKYLEKQLNEFAGKVVWLASYPKSGNTWFRCFLSALFTGEVDIRKIKTDGIFSGRQLFDDISGIDSRFLTVEETHNMLPKIYIDHTNKKNKLLFVKVHDAFALNQLGDPIFPSKITQRVIYLMRNPLDIVGSFAHHNASTIQKTIELMNNKSGVLGSSVEGLNINSQFPQLMLDWSGHVKSWVDQDHLDVTVVRYEDLLTKRSETFTKAIEDMRINAEPEDIERAIDLSNFDKLKKQENDKGFLEKNVKAESFFRSGKAEKYKDELTEDQINLITNHHEEVMSRFNYL